VADPGFFAVLPHFRKAVIRITRPLSCRTPKVYSNASNPCSVGWQSVAGRNRGTTEGVAPEHAHAAETSITNERGEMQPWTAPFIFPYWTSFIRLFQCFQGLDASVIVRKLLLARFEDVWVVTTHAHIGRACNLLTACRWLRLVECVASLDEHRRIIRFIPITDALALQ
jgi:hypothetical protein